MGLTLALNNEYNKCDNLVRITIYAKTGILIVLLIDTDVMMLDHRGFL